MRSVTETLVKRHREKKADEKAAGSMSLDISGEKKGEQKAGGSAAPAGLGQSQAPAPAAAAQPADHIALVCPKCTNHMLVPKSMKSGTHVACPHCSTVVATP